MNKGFGRVGGSKNLRFIEDPAGPKDYELLLFFADVRSKEFAKEIFHSKKSEGGTLST